MPGDVTVLGDVRVMAGARGYWGARGCWGMLGDVGVPGNASSPSGKETHSHHGSPEHGWAGQRCKWARDAPGSGAQVALGPRCLVLDTEAQRSPRLQARC